jgi:hypothetical protein
VSVVGVVCRCRGSVWLSVWLSVSGIGVGCRCRLSVSGIGVGYRCRLSMSVVDKTVLLSVPGSAFEHTLSHPYFAAAELSVILKKNGNRNVPKK